MKPSSAFFASKNDEIKQAFSHHVITNTEMNTLTERVKSRACHQKT